MRSLRSRFLLAAAGTCIVGISPAVAQDTPAETPGETTTPPATVGVLPVPKRTADYLDLTASLGYSTNPFLRVDGDGALFGRASARGVHSWRGPYSNTSISGFVEASQYFANDYGLQSIFAIDLTHSQRVSENVTLFGSIGGSGDVAGQLSSRFLATDPIIIDPTVPTPPVNVNDADLFSFEGRQYRVYGHAGASIRTSARGILSFSAGAQRWFSSNDFIDDYTNIDGTISYDHTLSERSSVGGSVSVVHTMYKGSDDETTVVTPAVNFRTRLSETWFATASLGVSFANTDFGGSSNNSTDLYASGTLCNQSEREELCAYVTQTTNASARESVVVSSSAGVDWSRHLDERQTIRLSAGYTHYDEQNFLDEKSTSEYWRAGASYDRRINERFFVGAEASARAFAEPGPNPDTDFGGTVYVRYRLGDLG